jgi:hypothetical protein
MRPYEHLELVRDCVNLKGWEKPTKEAINQRDSEQRSPKENVERASGTDFLKTSSKGSSFKNTQSYPAQWLNLSSICFILSVKAHRSEFLASTTKTAFALRLLGSVWFLGMLEGGTTMLPSSQGVCSDAQPGAPALG